MSDPANEGLQENNQCAPPGTTTYRKYAVYQKAGTQDWYTHTCHIDTVAYVQSGCTCIVQPIPPFIPGSYIPTQRPDNAKDYITNDGRKRFYMGSGATAPTGYIRVNRND
jgi:hypothetical protein